MQIALSYSFTFFNLIVSVFPAGIFFFFFGVLVT